MDHPEIFKNILLSAVTEGKEQGKFGLYGSEESDRLFAVNFLAEEGDEELNLFLREDQKKKRICKLNEAFDKCRPLLVATCFGAFTICMILYFWMTDELPEAVNHLSEVAQNLSKSE